MDFNEIFKGCLETLVTGILGVLSGFLIALAKKGFDWIVAKIESVKDDTIRKRLREATEVLHSTVVTTVTSLQQEFGDDIKESIKSGDGKFTREDLLELKDKAVDTVLSQLNVAVLDVLESQYDNIQGLIKDLIEVQVKALKDGAIVNLAPSTEA